MTSWLIGTRAIRSSSDSKRSSSSAAGAAHGGRGQVDLPNPGSQCLLHIDHGFFGDAAGLADA